MAGKGSWIRTVIVHVGPVSHNVSSLQYLTADSLVLEHPALYREGAVFDSCSADQKQRLTQKWVGLFFCTVIDIVQFDSDSLSDHGGHKIADW